MAVEKVAAANPSDKDSEAGNGARESRSFRIDSPVAEHRRHVRHTPRDTHSE